MQSRRAQGPPPAVRPADARRSCSTRGRTRRRPGPASPGPSSSLAARRRRSAPVFADRADFALQDEPRGTGDAVRAAPRRGPRGRGRGPRPVRRRAARRPAPTSRRVLEARREDDAAIALATVFAADPAPLGRVVRGEFGTVERIVEAKDATEDELEGNEINAGLYAFDAAWLRRRIDVARAVGGDRRAVPDRARPPRPRGRPARERRRRSRTTAGSTASTTARSWPPPSGTCGSALNEAHMRDGVTMRDPSTAYLDWDVDARRRRHPRAERHPARHDVGRGGERHRRRAASSSTATVGRARSGLGERRRVLDHRGRGDASGRSATCGRAASSAAARRSATSPSSRTPASAPAPSSTT